MHLSKLAIGLICLLGCQSVLAQQVKPLEIPLGSSNPIAKGSGPIELLLDEKSSSDKVEQIERGIRIEKLTGKNSDCGFVFKQSAKDFFTFRLDLEVLQLSAPRVPGPQGLMVEFVFDRPAPNTLTLGLICRGQSERGFTSYSGAPPKPNAMEFIGVPFSKGSLLFSREAEEIRLSISEISDTQGRSSFREVKRVDAGMDQLKEIRVVCRRQDSAKPPTEFLLNGLKFSGDEFYAQPAPRPPYWTATRIYSMLFWGCVLMVVGYLISRTKQIKNWVIEKLGG